MKETKAAWALAALFAAVVTGFKLGQHFCLQTQAYDLGVFANVIWNTGHGAPFWKSLTDYNYLADHFSPHLLLWAPLFWVWPNASALLVVQTLALAAAVPAVHRLSFRLTGNSNAALGFAAWFSVFPYLHRVSRFDFHDVSFGIPLLLWMWVFWEEGRRRAFWTCLVASLFIREDFALLAAGTGIYVALQSVARRDKSLIWAGSGVACLSLALLVLETSVVMPRFSTQWAAAEHTYFKLGGTLSEILGSLADPRVLWANTLGDPEKRKSLLQLLGFSGGLALFAPRQLALLALPIGYTVLSSRAWQFNFDLHYSATTLPFLFFAMIHGFRNVGEFLDRRWDVRWRWVFLGAMIAVSCWGLPRYFHRIPWRRVQAVRGLVQTVPKNDAVQAGMNLVPHFSLRRQIQVFPAHGRPDWVVLDTVLAGWRPPEEFRMTMEDFIARHRSRLVYDNEGLMAFRFSRT